MESTSKQQLALAVREPVQAVIQNPVPSPSGSQPADRHEDASRYCPVCSRRLESRRCKLICSVCGYYMSCSDYY